MKAVSSMVSALCLSLATLPLTQAGPLATRSNSPNPTRPFTVSAFQSPYPIGQGITGLNMTARGGNFYLSSNPNVQKAVLFVTGQGEAYLNSKKTQPIYIDTYDGHLGYANPAPAGAVFVDFVHLGHGNQVFTQEPNFTTQAPSIFQWIGSLGNNGWFACPKPNGEYQLFKLMTYFGPPDLSGCTVIDASALDAPNVDPEVDSYA